MQYPTIPAATAPTQLLQEAYAALRNYRKETILSVQGFVTIPELTAELRKVNENLRRLKRALKMRGINPDAVITPTHQRKIQTGDNVTHPAKGRGVVVGLTWSPTLGSLAHVRFDSGACWVESSSLVLVDESSAALPVAAMQAQEAAG